MADKEKDKNPSSIDVLGSDDPYFIHHSDNPTAVLVSPPLSGDNYGTWLCAMTMALCAKNKLGFVDGSIKEPKETTQLCQWERCNDLVSSWILNSTETNAALQQQDRGMEFLQGLHGRYSGLRSQILLMDPFPNATKIYALVRQEEKQQEIHSSRPSITTPEAAALAVNSAVTNSAENKYVPVQNRANFSSNNRAPHQNHPSNRQNAYSNQRNSGADNRWMGKSRMHCDYSDLDNHNIDTCYKLHGYPTDKPRNSRIALSAPSFSAWIIDTGASNHMCSSLSLFSSYKPCPNPSFVQLPDGSDAKITHIGTVVLSPDLQLDNDLSAKRTIGLGSVHGNLYYLQASSANLVTGTTTIDIWHWRLGHPSHQRMSELAKNVSSISYSPLHVCDIYISSDYTPPAVIPLPIEDHPQFDYAPTQPISLPEPNLIRLDRPPITQIYQRRHQPIQNEPVEVQTHPSPSIPAATTEPTTMPHVVDNSLSTDNSCDTSHTNRPPRERRKPSYLKDFHCSAVANVTLPTPTSSQRLGFLYPLEQYISYTNFFANH
ncbi:hypothetical protein RHSIM_Rhsim02G0167500 [Rhododendron simsii]|uniref:GAG-pre-integrase domain-containing protein n=1 Tax=Rhododendron simsii TaxID=118357 RepID=A0A834LUU0_RHOSS|nr:hypothetical protein RHSIM_Rhsim02G0167500 [Rhododendron simsii]